MKKNSPVLDFLKRADMFLLALCCACTIFGIVLISSATKSYGTMRYVYVQTGAFVIGLILFVLLSIVDLRTIADRWLWLLAFSVLFICTLFIWGEAGDSGNRGWLRFAGIGIQPAEVVKIPFIIVLAKQINYLREYRNLNSPFSVVQLLAHFFLMFALIIFSSSDLGSALVYLFIFVVMCFAGGLKLRYFVIGIALLAAGSPLIWKYFLSDYQRDRILAPYDPSIDPEGLDIKWQVNQSKIALASGRLTGEGLYNGTQSQSSVIPEKQTDFIFAIAGEELGMIGCIVIILLLTAVIIRCFYVGVKSKDYLSMLVCFGVGAVLLFQTFENIGMCIGITPVIGLTLPFFSYGGSSIVTMFMAVGLVSGVRMRQKKVVKKQGSY